jgi:hypothetical protein
MSELLPGRLLFVNQVILSGPPKSSDLLWSPLAACHCSNSAHRQQCEQPAWADAGEVRTRSANHTYIMYSTLPTARGVISLSLMPVDGNIHFYFLYKSNHYSLTAAHVRGPLDIKMQ